MLLQPFDVLLAQSSGKYVSDLAAFAKEVDDAYPFFDLKGIHQDWADTKPRLMEMAKTCATDTEFLGIVLTRWKPPERQSFLAFSGGETMTDSSGKFLLFIGSKDLKVVAPEPGEVIGVVVDENDQGVEQFDLRGDRVHLLGSDAIALNRSEYQMAHIPGGEWELLAIAGCTDRCVPLSMRPHVVQTVEIADGETKQLDLWLRQR